MRHLVLTTFLYFVGSSSAFASFNLDIDGDGKTDALTDGLLVLRYMFGLSGETLTVGVVGNDAERLDSDQIVTYLQTNNDQLDIDGDGQIDALTDGLLTLRYLFGLEGDPLINRVIAGGAIRDNPIQIQAHLKTLMPASPDDQIIYGTDGPDTLYAGPGNDVVYGLGGKDSLHGATGNDIIDGGSGQDKLYGGDGNDILYGSDNFDKLYGENGDDILDGGDGKDQLYGGSGYDIFITRQGDGSSGFTSTSAIHDFEDGVDKIRLDGGLNFSNLYITQGTQGSFHAGGYIFHYDYTDDTFLRAGNEYLFVILDTHHSDISAEDFN